MRTNRTQISEAQLRDIVHDVIMEEVQAQMLEEGWWSNMKSGLQTAFGNDINNAKNKATGVYSGAKQSAKNFGTRVNDKYNQAKQNVQQGYNNMRQGMQNRASAYKQGAQLQKRNDDINKLISLIDELIQNGTIHGKQTTYAANMLKKNLQMAVRGNTGGMTMARNYGV